MAEHTVLHPRASSCDGTHPPRHYSVVFHRDHPGVEVARFTEADNHRADAALFIAASDVLASLKWAVGVMEGDPEHIDSDWRYADAKAAVAKAEPKAEGGA